MYELTPMKVYALDRVGDDPLCRSRLERLLGALKIDAREVVSISEKNLSEIVGELLALWPPQSVPAGRVRSFMRPLVFTTMDLSAKRRDLKPLLQRCPPGTPLIMLRAIFGHMTPMVDQHPHQLDQVNNCVCWPTLNFGTMMGCPHGCLYCGDGRAGKLIAVALNLEEYIENVVGPAIEAYPWNRVLRMILNGADLITFEPEYGLHELFTRKLAQYEDRWGCFHTSSSNVEWLAELPHRDRLIGVWSVSCEAVARQIELGTGRAADRIEAARKCQDMGIPIRYKFKPVIPIRNWRDEYASIIEVALNRTRPESIGFCLYVWNTFDSMAQSLDLELLDPECVEAARQAAEQMKGLRNGPFPHQVRKEIYQFLIREVRRRDREVLLYVSTETREMWDELKDELGQDPRAYVCGCSSVAVPGRRLALSPAFRCSTYLPAPI